VNPRLEKLVTFLMARDRAKQARAGVDLGLLRERSYYETEVEVRLWDVMTRAPECEDYIRLVEGFYELTRGYDPRSAKR